MNFFKKWLKKQRNKSEIETKNTALLFSFVITALIFTVWIFTIISTNINHEESTGSAQLGSRDAAKPLDALMSNIKSILNN